MNVCIAESTVEVPIIFWRVGCGGGGGEGGHIKCVARFGKTCLQEKKVQTLFLFFL